MSWRYTKMSIKLLQRHLAVEIVTNPKIACVGFSFPKYNFKAMLDRHNIMYKYIFIVHNTGNSLSAYFTVHSLVLIIATAFLPKASTSATSFKTKQYKRPKTLPILSNHVFCVHRPNNVNYLPTCSHP